MKKLFFKIAIAVAEFITGSWAFNFFVEYRHAQLIVYCGAWLDLDHMPEGSPSKKRTQWWCKVLKGVQ